jgi:hypothetical protein
VTVENFAEVAVLDRGPLDGREHPAAADIDELVVEMTDGHRYRRTGRAQNLNLVAARPCSSGSGVATRTGEGGAHGDRRRVPRPPPTGGQPMAGPPVGALMHRARRYTLGPTHSPA